MRLAVCCLAFVTACSSDPMHGDDEPVNCAEETRDDDFVVGLDKVGESGMLDFKLMSANPAPPARDDNTWIVQVSSMSGGTVGAPVSGVAMSVTPFMPDHSHGSGKTVVVEPTPDAGQYKLSPVNMWMPGLWETTINASSASGSDKVVFRFCIPS